MGLAFGCSLVVGQDAAQCHVDADCGRFPGTRCAFGGCVPRDGGTDVAVDPNRPCTSSQDCFAIHGSNWVCRSQQCQFLGSDECGIVIGNTSADDVLVIGAIVPYGQKYQSTGLPMERALGLAQEDFQTAGGVPFGGGVALGSDGGPTRHPLAIVLCDETTNPTLAAKHLVEEVHVPILFGPAFGDSVAAVTAETDAHGVLLVSPYTTADLDASSGLVWRTSPNSDGEAAAINGFLRQWVLPRVAVDSGAPRVALAWREDADGVALHERLKPLLDAELGGDAEAGTSLQDVDYGNPDVDREPLTRAVTTLTSPVPDVIVIAGKSEGITAILAAIESDPSLKKPMYVLSQGMQIKDALALAATSPTLGTRAFFVAPGDVESQNGPMRELLFRYRALYNPEAPAETYGITQSFDAFYLLAYALAHVRNTDVSGRDVREGLLANVVGLDAAVIEAGHEGIDPAFAAILSGGAVSLRGASGPLAFDAATGTPSSDVQIACIASGTTPAFVQSTVTWHAATQTLDGKPSAACGF
jgi:ABC-type branched-subunit amino acid transport system substrate-binding protein